MKYRIALLFCIKRSVLNLSSNKNGLALISSCTFYNYIASLLPNKATATEMCYSKTMSQTELNIEDVQLSSKAIFLFDMLFYYIYYIKFYYICPFFVFSFAVFQLMYNYFTSRFSVQMIGKTPLFVILFV